MPLLSVIGPSHTGIHFKNELKETEDFNIIEYLYFNNGAGVAVGDINNDNLNDIYFTSNQNTNKLYLNKGNLKFEDITGKAGVSGEGNWKTGVSMADVNGDGFLDIYVCGVGNYKKFNGRNQLFINQGDMTFKESAMEYGLDFSGFSTQAVFFDYDRDGDLDMYLLNHSVHTKRSYGDISLRSERDSLAGDRLFRNDEVNGKRFFNDITEQAGIFSSQIGYGLGISISDFNNDGLPDIYISNDFHENDYIYINNGDGTFKESHSELLSNTSRSSMGNDAADINNDGFSDIIVLDMLPDNEKKRKRSGGEDDFELFEFKRKLGYGDQFVRNTLQLNLGNGLFSEIGRLAGIYSTDWSWSPLLCDFDNDGWRDLFITTGIFRRANDLDYIKFLTGGSRYGNAGDNRNKTDEELYKKMPLQKDVNHLFKNNADLTFKDMSSAWGLNVRSFSNGAATADLDNDGDLDLIVNNINSNAFIYRNNSERISDNHFLSLNLKGNNLNNRGTGSRVYLFTGGKMQMAEQFTARGFMSASQDIIHFGTGKAKVIDSVRVIWPDGSQQLLKNIPADQNITLNIKDAGKPGRAMYKQKELNYFTKTNINGLYFRHKEDEYTDLRREFLIPHSLSAESPAMTTGDVNGDGLDDLFIGGAKGQKSMIFFQQDDGGFRQLEISTSIEDDFTDDVDAAFLDADNDGDTDLYIVHGGNEYPEGNPLLTDRLLINDGKGNFTTTGNLPFISHNGSCVRPCDFDNDGDVDLFIGSRSIPGSYGLSPNNYILKNDGKGNFRILDKNMFNLAGMVTDATWTDYDGDGDNDLIVAGEWMNITIFRNDNGIFNEASNQSGLNKTQGWWYSVHAADIDSDGDMDIICGNIGLNSMLKASEKEPVEMILNDFDNDGSIDQIICSSQDGRSYPIASLDELAGKIPAIGKKYISYSDFAGRTTEEIFGNYKSGSVIKKAVLFESCIFLNNGNGTFKMKKLPMEAQFSPMRDVLVHDLNRDGIKDLIIAGNDYAVRPSLGKYDACFGWCLLGDKANIFQPLMPYSSGLIIRGDARKIRFIKIAGKTCVAASVNNDRLQIFKLNE